MARIVFRILILVLAGFVLVLDAYNRNSFGFLFDAAVISLYVVYLLPKAVRAYKAEKK